MPKALTMLGLMQDDLPLLVSSLIDYAEKFHGDREIVTRPIEGPIHRYTYKDAASRSKKTGTPRIAAGGSRRQASSSRWRSATRLSVPPRTSAV